MFHESSVAPHTGMRGDGGGGGGGMGGGAVVESNRHTSRPSTVTHYHHQTSLRGAARGGPQTSPPLPPPINSMNWPTLKTPLTPQGDIIAYYSTAGTILTSMDRLCILMT